MTAINFEPYDMLFFVDDKDNIYQDCVVQITKLDKKCYQVICNNFNFVVDARDRVIFIRHRSSEYRHVDFRLLEHWYRLDENTYTKEIYEEE